VLDEYKHSTLVKVLRVEIYILKFLHKFLLHSLRSKSFFIKKNSLAICLSLENKSDAAVSIGGI